MKRILSPLLAIIVFFATTLPVNAATYVVQSGDTLYSIARRHGTTVDALMRANGLSSTILWVGQQLQIGSSSPSSPTGSHHTVVRGDTLYSIARQYGTTVEALMRANHLSSTYIYVGQRLLITSSTTPPAGSVTYTVVRGDTLYSIAQRHGTTVDAIKAANALFTTYIYVGQRLRIPSTKTPMVPSATPTPVPTGTTTPTPTTTPVTATPIPSSVIIQDINYDGMVPDSESDEYAVIANTGTTPVSIGGWRLHADDAGQDFDFPEFELEPGQECRVYTNEVHSDSCGFSFGRGSAVWNNDGDCGYLYNDDEVLVSTFCYSGEES